MKHDYLMRVLPAHSLVETVVASVIFMIVFLMAMHSFTQLIGYDMADPHELAIELEMQKVRKQLVVDAFSQPEQNYSCGMCDIQVYITPYKDKSGIYIVELFARSLHAKKMITYRYLQAERHIENNE